MAPPSNWFRQRLQAHDVAGMVGYLRQHWLVENT